MPRPGLMRVPQVVAVVTLGAGIGLLVAPAATSGLMGLGGRPGFARAIGVMDLVLVPGLLCGRPRWPWMLARAAFNLPIAAAYGLEARADGNRGIARVGMFAMLGLSVVDTATAVALHNAESVADAC